MVISEEYFQFAGNFHPSWLAKMKSSSITRAKTRMMMMMMMMRPWVEYEQSRDRETFREGLLIFNTVRQGQRVKAKGNYFEYFR